MKTEELRKRWRFSLIPSTFPIGTAHIGFERGGIQKVKVVFPITQGGAERTSTVSTMDESTAAARGFE